MISNYSSMPALAGRMRFTRLPDWLAWQESLHVREIELGLERCQQVAQRLGLRTPDYQVVTVSGTNGKGSTVAMLDAILRSSGYQVATYTSPHLLCYNERVRLNGEPVSDEQLCEAFQAVDEARGGVSLTYFEFGTLAAFHIFQHQDLDVAVLEVGLGGRLDAVNLLDADVAVIPAIGIDHVEWLGATREAIAREKAGIFRPGRPAVCSDPLPPQTLIECAEHLGTRLCLLGRDFEYAYDGDSWHWRAGSVSYQHLPRPNLSGDYQFQNAAGVLMALEALAHRLPVPEEAIRRGLSGVKLAGRFQVFPGPVEYLFDVAHNPQAAEALARTLKQYPRTGKTHALVGMLKDKDSRSFFRILDPVVDQWSLVGLPGPRGSAGQHLAHELVEVGVSKPATVYDDIPKALAALQSQGCPGDRILVTGSFLTVAGVMKLLGASV